MSAAGGAKLRDRRRPARGSQLPAPSASAVSLPCSSSPGRRGRSGHHLTVTAGARRWDPVAGVKLHMTTAHRENPGRAPSPRGPPGCHTPREGDLIPLLPVGSPPRRQAEAQRPQNQGSEPSSPLPSGGDMWGDTARERAPFQRKCCTIGVSEALAPRESLTAGSVPSKNKERHFSPRTT